MSRDTESSPLRTESDSRFTMPLATARRLRRRAEMGRPVVPHGARRVLRGRWLPVRMGQYGRPLVGAADADFRAGEGSYRRTPERIAMSSPRSCSRKATSAGILTHHIFGVWLSGYSAAIERHSHRMAPPATWS